jgi:hypothetical protein
MAIDLDDLMSDSEEQRDPRVAIVHGLVVSEKAVTGNDLVAESELYLQSDKIPAVAFVVEDENGNEIFAEDATGDYRGDYGITKPQTQARAFASAMGLGPGVLPSPAESLAWSSRTLGAVQHAFRTRK